MGLAKGHNLAPVGSNPGPLDSKADALTLSLGSPTAQAW